MCYKSNIKEKRDEETSLTYVTVVNSCYVTFPLLSHLNVEQLSDGRAFTSHPHGFTHFFLLLSRDCRSRQSETLSHIRTILTTSGR